MELRPALRPPGGCRYDRARRVGQPQLAGARVAKPDDDVRRIRPKERTNFARHSNRFIDSEPLQCLNVKNAIIKLALGAVVSVNTLPLTICRSSHNNHHIPRAAAARIESLLNASGLNK